jgi:hypothetical protein
LLPTDSVILDHTVFSSNKDLLLAITYNGSWIYHKCYFCNVTKLNVLLYMHSSLDEHLYEINASVVQLRKVRQSKIEKEIIFIIFTSYYVLPSFYVLYFSGNRL